MATKPGLTAFTHATDANIGSGPAAGFPTKNPVSSPAQGFIPGLGISAQQVNIVLNEIGTWLNDWVSKGDFAADASAHIVETDAQGTIRALGATIGTPTLAVNRVLVVENQLAGETVSVRNHGTGRALTLIGGTDKAVCEMSAFRATDEAVLRLRRNFGAGSLVRGTLALDPQTDPNTTIEGDVWITPSVAQAGQTGRSRLTWADQTDGGTQFFRAWATNKGYYFRSGESRGTSLTTNNEGSLVTKLLLSVDPKAGSKYKVTFSCAVATVGVTDAVVGVKFDTGIAGKSATYKLFMPSAAIFMPVSVSWVVDGNASAMDNTIEFFSLDGQTGVEIKDAEIIFEGSHDEIE